VLLQITGDVRTFLEEDRLRVFAIEPAHVHKFDGKE